MKKDIKWLKAEIENMEYTRIKRAYMDDYVSISKKGVLELINQLGKLEVLSQEWIDKSVVHFRGLGDFLEVIAVENLLLPKQELPVIPQWVADDIESKKKVGTRLNVAMSEFPESKLEQELGIDEHECNELYARAWLDGYEVEEDPLYYALIKGHELVNDEGEWSTKYWNLWVSEGCVFPYDKSPHYDDFSMIMTKSEWGKWGINDSNADFVKVEEAQK